jgi:hypothetical protein
MDGQPIDPLRFRVKRTRGPLHVELIEVWPTWTEIGLCGRIEPTRAWQLFEWRGDAWHQESRGVGDGPMIAGSVTVYRPPSGTIVSLPAPGIRQVELSVRAAGGRRPMGGADYEV